MCFIMRKVATEGCEILNEDGEIIGWSINEERAEKIVDGLDIVAEHLELEEVA